MRSIYFVFTVLVFFSCRAQKVGEPENVAPMHTEHVNHSQEPKKKSLSPHTSAMAMIGEAHIHIDYSSPGVRDRIVFGGLLSYDRVWQAGAHMATWLETNKDLEFEGQLLKAGKYGVFMIPGKSEWVVIFNSNWEQHGKDEYDEKDDVVRFKVIPEHTEEIKEHLEYTIEQTNSNEGKITLNWEKVRISFPFSTKP